MNIKYLNLKYKLIPKLTIQDLKKCKQIFAVHEFVYEKIFTNQNGKM